MFDWSQVLGKRQKKLDGVESDISEFAEYLEKKDIVKGRVRPKKSGMKTTVIFKLKNAGGSPSVVSFEENKAHVTIRLGSGQLLTSYERVISSLDVEGAVYIGSNNTVHFEARYKGRNAHKKAISNTKMILWKIDKEDLLPKFIRNDGIIFRGDGLW